ncbi:hypothetical protein AB0A70_20175 [Streptomyces morookaense]|uniref:hypothetical protein n=1 Tax=Streptomyces morookaense TaxID=1970 RepID=UPI0033EC215F
MTVSGTSSVTLRPPAQTTSCRGTPCPLRLPTQTPNQLEDTFKVEVDLKRPVGTKGQTGIRIIVTGDGRVFNTLPFNP